MVLIHKNGTALDGCRFMSDTHVGKGVRFFPNSVIGRPPASPRGLTEIDYAKLDQKPVVIGEGSVVGANVVMYNDVIIGKRCLIGDGVKIREGVVIGDNCIIGIGCKVGARTVLGNETRVMDLTNVASDATLGEHVFIGPGVMMGNDNSMGREKDSQEGLGFVGPIIEDWATVGMNASILPGMTIGKDALVGANSVITRDVAPHTLVMGVPAKYIRDLNEGEIRCPK